MKDGTTGQILYQSTNPTQVANNAIGNLTQGGNILFKAGTYTVSQTITWSQRNNVELVFEEGAKLVAANGLNAPVVHPIGSNGLTIRNIEIDGNAAGQTAPAETSPHIDGILITFGDNVLIDEAYIYNCKRDGIGAMGATNYLTIRNSIITNCGWNGITACGGVSVSSVIEKNEISHVSDVGITIYGANYVVNNNWVHDLDGVQNTRARWGIAVEDPYDGPNTIRNNLIERCSWGIVLAFDQSVGISDPGGEGHHTITYNTINYCQCGVVVATVEANTISYNTITNWNVNGGDGGGITLWSSRNVVEGNTLIITDGRITKGGVWIWNSLPPVGNIIRNNDFTLCTNPKILDQGIGTIISGNVGYP